MKVKMNALSLRYDLNVPCFHFGAVHHEPIQLFSTLLTYTQKIILVLPRDPSRTGPNSGQFGTIVAILSPGENPFSNKCDPNFFVKVLTSLYKNCFPVNPQTKAGFSCQ